MRHGHRLSATALSLVLVVLLASSLAGCSPTPDLPEVDGIGEDEPTATPQPADDGIDPQEFVPGDAWTLTGTYGGTSSEAKRLNVLDPNTEYRFLCTVDPAPGDAPVAVTFWLEYGGQMLSEPQEVSEGASGGFEFVTGERLPPNGIRLSTQASGFASWQVEVYEPAS